MNPLEPLPSSLPVPPTPVPTRPPAAGRSAVPPDPGGRRPAGVLPAPLDARVRFEKLAQRVVIAFLRPGTDEVVRQIPPEEVLQFSIYLRQLAVQALDTHA